jgi:hypothetical protein
MNPSQLYALKFVPDYAAGDMWDETYYKVKMNPSEALNRINTQEWHTIGFEIEILAEPVNHSVDLFGVWTPRSTA